jgi:hypothetical protein
MLPIQSFVLIKVLTSLNLLEPLLNRSPERVTTCLATGGNALSTPSPTPPALLKLELDNCLFTRPLPTVIRRRDPSLHAVLTQRTVHPPFSFPSTFCRTPTPPLNNVINHDSEKKRDKGRSTLTPIRYDEQEEEQEGREDTPQSNIVSETTQEETRSTSGDSFVLSPTSPLLQSSSKTSFVSSSVAYQVALGQKPALPFIFAPSRAENASRTRAMDQPKGLPTSPVPKRGSITVKSPSGILEGEEVAFYARVRKRRIFRKDELADSVSQSPLAAQSCTSFSAHTGDGYVEEQRPMRQWTLHPKVVRVVDDSDPEPTLGPTLFEKQRQRQRLRAPPHVRGSPPRSVVDSEESEARDRTTNLGSTAAAPIVLGSDPDTEVEVGVHRMRSRSVVNISSGEEAREEEEEVELPVTTLEKTEQECTVPAPGGRFLCVEVPTLRQVRRARARAAGKLARNWASEANPQQRSWNLKIPSRSCFSTPRRPHLPSSSPSEDELNWDEEEEQEMDGGRGGVVVTPDYTRWLQRTHAKRFGCANAKTRKAATLHSFPPPINPKKRKRQDTDREGDTDELDEWVPEPVQPAALHTRRKTTREAYTETESATDGTVSRPGLSVRRLRNGGPAIAQFQCLIPGTAFTRPPTEPFRTAVTQANAAIDPSTIRVPRFSARGPGYSFGCHNCRSSVEKNVKIRCSNIHHETGAQCNHHWCERCLVMWYAFDGRGLLSAYAFSGEVLGSREVKALGARGTDGGVGLGLGVVPGKWICPNCLRKCMCTYCTNKDGRLRSRFKKDAVGVPLDLEGLEELEGAPGLRGTRLRAKKASSGHAPTTPFAAQSQSHSHSHSLTSSVVSVAAGFPTQHGEFSTTASSTTRPEPGPGPAARRPRVPRELQDLLTPEFGHAMHVNDQGELEVYKQDAAGNVVCVGVPTRMRTRACPDGAPESTGGIGVSATELYKPVFLPGERERWRQEVGLGEAESASASEGEGESGEGEVEEEEEGKGKDQEVERMPAEEGLPRRANFVNVPWGAKLPRAQKRHIVQHQPGCVLPVAVRQLDGAGSQHGYYHHVEPVLSRAQFDPSSLLNFDAETDADHADDRCIANTSTNTNVNMDGPYTVDLPTQVVRSTSVAVPSFPPFHPVQDAVPAQAPVQEWGGWETIALEFGDPSFDPLPSCGPGPCTIT